MKILNLVSYEDDPMPYSYSYEQAALRWGHDTSFDNEETIQKAIEILKRSGLVKEDVQ